MVDAELAKGQSRYSAIGRTCRKRDRQRNLFSEHPAARAVWTGEKSTCPLSPAGRAGGLRREPDPDVAAVTSLFPS